MVRNVGLMMLVVGIAHIGATQGMAGQSVVRDTFDDNTQSAMWRLLADDVGTCRVREANRRLELVANSQANDAWAAYIGNGWWLDLTADFAIKVDFHYDPVTLARGSVCVGVTPDSAQPWQRNVAIGVGCADRFSHYWYQKQDGLIVYSSASQRSWTDGILCISYSAAADELYVSLRGYGQENAWTTFPGLLRGDWQAASVFVWLGGNSDGLTLGSGRAHLDELRVERGAIPQSVKTNTYRFWSPKSGKHFYTTSDTEKNKLLVDYPEAWTYEGVSFLVFPDDADPMACPVYRFWSDKLNSHFYTVSARERDKLVADYSHVWTYEGIAFYAYGVGKEPLWAYPVYRFWSPGNRAHFYTASEGERDEIMTEYGDVWIYEGVAWFADR
jgi:hypothetical protein